MARLRIWPSHLKKGRFSKDSNSQSEHISSCQIWDCLSSRALRGIFERRNVSRFIWIRSSWSEIFPYPDSQLRASQCKSLLCPWVSTRNKCGTRRIIGAASRLVGRSHIIAERPPSSTSGGVQVGFCGLVTECLGSGLSFGIGAFWSAHPAKCANQSKIHPNPHCPSSTALSNRVTMLPQ